MARAGATSGTLAASKIHDATYGTLADGSVLVAADGTYVDPANSDVWHGVAIGVSPRVGTKQGSSITNLTAANLASGVTVDNVGPGTFTHTSDYELITTGDSRVASQLSTDQDSVLASAAYILSDHSILSQAGTFDLAGDEAIQYAAGEAAQLVADKAAVNSGKADILNTRTILTVQGTFTLATHDAGVASTQHSTDAAFLETNKAEIIAADTAIYSQFGVTGTAPSGVDPSTIVFPTTDEVDGGVSFGYPNNMTEGTGVNAATLLTTLGLSSGDLHDELAALPGAVVASLGSRQVVSIPVPLAINSVWNLVQGSAYLNADGRAQVFTCGTATVAGGLCNGDLSGWGVELTIADKSSPAIPLRQIIQKTATVTSATGIQRFYVELTTEETMLLTSSGSVYLYELVAKNIATPTDRFTIGRGIVNNTTTIDPTT